MKECNNCGVTKEESEFYYNVKKDKYSDNCKDCFKELKKDKYKQDKIKEEKLQQKKGFYYALKDVFGY